MVVPAHVWTPWYAVYGSKGGFDSLEECFGDMAGHIHAIETGLSSDPAMNWRVPEPDGRALVSFSDAHSALRMGRELTIFSGGPLHDGLRDALAGGGLTGGGIDYTVEFYPEKSKYHYDGHRKCDVCQRPAVTMEHGERCPVCGRKLTLGVLHRIEELSSRPEAVQREGAMWRDPSGLRPPFNRLVPLAEIIAGVTGRGVATKTVHHVYDLLIKSVGSELQVLGSPSFPSP
jgi:DNA helicase-2/ATP-dependent DNA helicase PcrA